jgi:predicted RNA-binding Zn ribbon-like protein
MPLPHRVAGNLALDLANTVSWRGTDRETDHLLKAGDVVAWAKKAGLVDSRFEAAPRERGALVKRTLALRTAIGEAGSAISQGRKAPASALNVIRDLAAEALQAADIAGSPAIFVFNGIDKIVGAVAWSALDLLRGDELSRLKQCPAENCQWLFIDRTKNGSRRWCDMTTCGNRAKKQAHRQAKGSRV